MFKEIIDEIVKLIKEPANNIDHFGGIINPVPNDLLMAMNLIFNFSDDTDRYKRYVASEDFTRIYFAYDNLPKDNNGKYYFSTQIFFRGNVCTIIMLDYDTVFGNGNEKEALASMSCVISDIISSIKLRYVQYLNTPDSALSSVFAHAFPIMFTFIIRKVYRCNDTLIGHMVECLKEITKMDYTKEDVLAFGKLNDELYWLDNSLIASIDLNPRSKETVSEKEMDENGEAI